MKFLLDTHTLIWSITDRRKLSSGARKILENTDNIIAVSSVTFWEISLKFSLGKLLLEGVVPEDFPKLALETGFKLISVLPEDASTYHQLSATWHKDPFDRMLIWQSIRQSFVLISKDDDIAKYKSEGLEIFW